MFNRLSRRLAGSVLLWDVLLTLISLYLTSSVRRSIAVGMPLGDAEVQLPWPLYPAVAVIWIVVFLLLIPQRALFTGTVIEAVGRLLAAVALSVLSFAGLLYLSFRDVSRLQFLYFAAMDLIALLMLHVLLRFYIHNRVRQGGLRRVLIVGAGAQAQQLMHEFARRPWAGVIVLGYTGDQLLDNGGTRWLGPMDRTPQVVEEERIDEVIFVTSEQERIATISLQLQQQPVMLHMVPSVLDLAFARTPVEILGGIPLISLRESALTEPQRILKRLFDVVGSSLLLIILSPLLILIAIGIKLESSGPIFFWQERIGEQGQRFTILKFRSMSPDADSRWQEVARRDEHDNLVHKHDDDPRVTRLGRMLRRTSLDELPQLLNVLRGEMSLVGPRPEMPYMAAEYAPWQWQRFRVPPGITGWWQVNGRSIRPLHLNTEDDLYYIQNYSFWLDLKILLMTVGTVLKGRGAF